LPTSLRRDHDFYPDFPVSLRFNIVSDFFRCLGTHFAKPYFVRDWLTHRETRCDSE